MIKRLLLLVLACSTLSAQTPFSLDSAAVYLETLAVEIGARPMGSPNEQRALEFARQKFRDFGLHESYIMPIERAQSYAAQAPVNTRTGIAVGVLKGKTERVIVIGGHIDSAGPEIPGANDDGSGCAVVLELARVLAQRPNESTIVFALFGGEEQGLVGSRYFVDNFPDIDKVVLMLQVDMANGSDWLVPFVDAQHHSAPVWLVKAAYEEFAALGYRGLSYPTHFFVLNNALPGGGAGSDHQPFLERGIPAIDFTSDINDPIHTPQDTFDNFKLAGLKRSGDLVYRLVERFDNGVPEEKTGRYFLYEVGPIPLFVPLWSLNVFLGIALALALFAFISLRRRATPTSDEGHNTSISTRDARLPALKLFLLALIIQSCVWLSENVVGVVKGLRYPWWSDVNAYLGLGFLGGVVGIWLALQLTPHLKLSTNPQRYFLRAAIMLCLLLVLFALQSSKLAFYPATALFFLSLAMLIQQPGVRIVFWFASAHFMFHLLFSEGLGLWTHALAAQPRSTLASVLVHVFYILFFALWSFPFLLGFAAVRFDAKVDYFWLSHFRLRRGGLLSGAAFFLYAGYLVSQPSFSPEWKQLITVEQRIDLQTGQGTTALTSNENVDGVVVRLGDRDTSIAARVNQVSLQDFSVTEPWVTVSRSVQSQIQDSVMTVDLRIRLTTRHRPYSLRLTYTSPKGFFLNAASPLVFSRTSRSLSFRWYSFPDSSIEIPVRLSLLATDSLQEAVEATFVQPVGNIRAQLSRSTVIYRSTFTSSDTFSLIP